jgi:hypothetical protein
MALVCEPNERPVLSTSRPFWLLDDICILEPTKTVILDSSLLSWSPYSPNGTTWVNWQSETEVTIDSVQKKPPCGACRGGGSFVFPRSVRANETEPGRSRLSAKSQDLPAAY